MQSTCQPEGPYSFLGGHRLWRSPELMPETYARDDRGLRVEPLPDGVRLTQPDGLGLSKSIEVHLAADRPAVTLLHRIANRAQKSVRLAPWTLTMLQLGGVAILPQPVGNSDTQGLLPNRRLALWPYSRLGDARLHWGDDFILLQAEAALPPFKLGWYNPAGWSAYWLNGVLFRKSCAPFRSDRYPDGGCNAETYCNDRFIELEGLGALKTLQPGAETELTETWELFSSLEQPFLPERIRRLIRELEPSRSLESKS